MTLRWSLTAADDLANIYEYIAADNPEAAIRTLQSIYKAAAERLLASPGIGRRTVAGRELVLPPFVIAYHREEEVIGIDAVLHGSRIY